MPLYSLTKGKGADERSHRPMPSVLHISGRNPHFDFQPRLPRVVLAMPGTEVVSAQMASNDCLAAIIVPISCRIL